jgi:hypothetical protein
VFEYAPCGEMFDKVIAAGHYTESEAMRALRALLVKFSAGYPRLLYFTNVCAPGRRAVYPLFQPRPPG